MRLHVLVIAMMITLTAFLQAQPESSSSDKPNILLIVVDDLGYLDVGLHGGPKTPTPNIDSIAQNGVNFTNGYVSAPICGPSRAGILTGRYQNRFGYVCNHGPVIPENFGLPVSIPILPELLKSGGYKTGMAGKWHLGFKPEMQPQSRGFDSFLGHLHGYHDYKPGSDKPGPILRNGKETSTEEWLTTEIGNEAIRFINDNKDTPWFLYLPFNAVHSPLQAPQNHLKRFEHIENERERKLAAMIYELDETVGRVLQTLRDSGKEDNTVIIFLTDNGGPLNGNPHANGILRDGKGSVYEGGIRVPLFIQWKKALAPGTVYNKPVIALDLAPTILAAAEVKPQSEFDGVNLLPYILSEKSTAPHQSLYWNQFDNPSRHAIRSGDWKAVQPTPDAPWELYNLRADAREEINLAADHPDLVNDLASQWAKWDSHNAEPLFIDSRLQKKSENSQND